MTALLVAAGAAVGAPLRYVAGHLLDDRWPWGTVLVNWVGSVLLGLFTGLGLSGGALARLGAGVCGGLTTNTPVAGHRPAPGPPRGAGRGAPTGLPALALCALGFWLGAR